MAKGKGLNSKYEKFAQEYVIDFNGTRAAIAAGYSEKTAHVKSSQLLKIVKVKERIDELKKKSEKRSQITMDDIRKGVADIAINGDKEADRLKAYDMLTKMFGGYEEHNDQKKPDLKATIKFTK